MPTVPNGSLILRCESLESRETPAGISLVETFDAARFPFTPTGWQQWASNGQEYYGTSRAAATSGTQSLALYGNLNVRSRLWNSTATGNDVTIWANVRSDTPAPVLIFARGTGLNTATASYVGLTVNKGGVVSVVESVNGRERTLASVAPQGTLPTTWLNVSMSMVGTRVNFRVVRADTQQFLASNGQWQAGERDAIITTVAGQTPNGFSGIGRQPGNYGTAYVDDFAVTPIESSQLTAQKYSHIRVAELAYDGTPIGALEKQLAANSVDLIIPNVNLLNAFEVAAPATTKIIYSNVSNLYLNLYTDWLKYADRTGTNRESAFYHVTQATPFSGASPSSVPVVNLWNASRGAASGTGTLTDLTANARGGRSTGVNFGTAGEAVNLSYPERFRELNITLNRGANSAWNGVWEYVTATDANGKPTAWKLLSLLADGTNRLATTGQIAFDPPRDWVASTIGTADRLFSLRFRVTAGTAAQAPDAKTIFGRDYVNAKGTSKGTIPAFDYTADRDGDGYLNAQEYSSRRTGFDARFISESRLLYPNYGQMRFVTNPTSAAVKSWAAQFHVNQLAGAPNADGIFLDNAGGRLPFAGTPVIEATTNFTVESANLVTAVRQATNKVIVANTSGGRTEANSITKAAGVAFEEFLLRPNDVNWSSLGDVANTVNQRLNSNDPKSLVVLDSHPGSTANMTDPRTQLGALSYYYLLGDPSKTYLSIWGGFAPNAGWSNKWIPAIATNIGQPKGAMTTFATGKDPQNANLNFKLFSREYDNALVLFKPRSYTLGKGTGTNENATATTHQLNGNYRELRADGTLGQVVRQVTLRNGEGAVLMKA